MKPLGSFAYSLSSALWLASPAPPPVTWAANEFVLNVSPATGQAAFRSLSPVDVAIDGYAVRSPSGSLIPATWNSLQDQAVAGWEQAPPAASAMAVAELKADGSLQFQNQTGFNLGALFKTVGATQDLQFEYLLPGSQTPSVGEVTYGVFTPPISPDLRPPVAYEKFDYSPPGADLLGANGGSQFGGPWVAGGPGATQQANFDIGAGSLSFLNLSNGGNRVTTAALAANVGGVQRQFLNSIGSPGETRYLSFLIRPEGTLNEGMFNGFFGLLLDASTTTDLFIGKPGGGALNQFVLENHGGTQQHASGVTAAVGEEYLLVVRADFAAGNDLFTLHVNPTPGAPEPLSGTIKNDSDVGTVNRLSILSTGAFSIDEIRMGETFADVTPVLDLLPGDFDEDEDVDGDDLANWRAGFGTAGTAMHRDGDADADADVDGADLLVWQREFDQPPSISGDVNENGVTDINDYVIIRNNFNGTNKTLATGDLNGDTIVNFADFRIWKNDRTAAVPAVDAIPEPSAWALALPWTAWLGAGACRNRR